MLRNKMSGTIMLIFIFGMDRAKLFFWQSKCQTFFWQPKPLLAVGTWELVAFILGSIFLAVKSVFGRILPNIKVGTISAKNKSWQTQYFFCFLHVHIVTHFVWPHTPRTQQKKNHLTSHIQHITHTTPCGAGGARDERQRQHAAVAVARPAAAAREVKEGLTPAAGEETEASRRP
jgi:hypothetical protein